MKKRIQDRTYYPNERRVHAPSYGNGRSPQPSHKRRVNAPSYGNGRSPQPSHKRRVNAPSYGNGRSPQPSYKRRVPSPSYNQNHSPSASYKRRVPPPSYNQNHSPSSSYKGTQTRKKLARSYKNMGPGRANMKKIGIGAACLLITSLLVYSSFSIFNPLPIEGGNNSGVTIDEKIAIFFWASDAGTQGVIDEYIDILTDEGYTKFFNFKDTNNFASDFQQVEDYEDPNDIVFFYIIGHGYNDGQHSHTAFAPSSSSVSSNEFREKCDTLDSSRVGLLIESCKSGDWSDDMRGGGYLAISTSDENHNAYAVGGIPGEGLFSNAFFDEIVGDSNAIDAFSVAEALCKSTQYPKLCDESAYDFFAD